MKNLIFLLAALNSFGVFAQKEIHSVLEVKYDIYYNTEMPNTKKGTLFIDQTFSKSLFTYGSDKSKKVEEINSENVINIKLKGTKRFNYVDFSLDSIYSKETIIDNDFIIAEKKLNLKWALINESKTIDSLQVKKALLHFRGRNYTAWYSEAYPIKFGPWKFQNLPGLIIEIYDETKRYHWRATSISKNRQVKTIDFHKMQDGAEKISIENYVDKRYNSKVELVNSSRLPRGSMIEDKQIKRNGIEIKFQWEEGQIED